MLCRGIQGSRLCGAGFAMDSEGREGEPVLIEAVVPSQI